MYPNMCMHANRYIVRIVNYIKLLQRFNPFTFIALIISSFFVLITCVIINLFSHGGVISKVSVK